jgi:hypothetical protein
MNRLTQNSRRRTATGLTGIAALLAVAVVAWNTVGPGHSDTAALDAMPEAGLAPPGSVLVRQGSRQRRAESAAAIQRDWLTPATPDEVVSFYQTELAARGWTEGASDSGIPFAVETRVCGWHKEGIRFRLGFPNGRMQTAAPTSNGMNRYEVRLIAVDTPHPDATLCAKGLPIP